MWLLLIALHLIGLVGYTILLRRSALSSINKFALAALMQSAITLPAYVFLFFGKVHIPSSGQEIFWLVFAGFMLIGLHLTTVRALQHIEASQFTIIYNLRLLFTTILGFIVLNEAPKPLQLVGGGVIFISVLLLNLHKNQRYKSKPVQYALLATVWLSVFVTLEKHIVTTTGFETYMVVSGTIGMSGLWILSVFKGFKYKDLKKHIDKGFIGLLIFRPLSAWAFVLSFRHGQVAVSNYVSGMSVALIVLFGIVFLNERQQMRQKLYAVICAFLGLSLILISKLPPSTTSTTTDPTASSQTQTAERRRQVYELSQEFNLQIINEQKQYGYGLLSDYVRNSEQFDTYEKYKQWAKTLREIYPDLGTKSVRIESGDVDMFDLVIGDTDEISFLLEIEESEGQYRIQEIMSYAVDKPDRQFDGRGCRLLFQFRSPDGQDCPRF